MNRNFLFGGAILLACAMSVRAASGPIVQYEFDEGSGAVANDSSGNGNAGTLAGSPTYVADFTGQAGKYALQFNGTDQKVYTNSTFVNPQVFSLALRFKTTTATGGRLIGFGDSQTGRSPNSDRFVYMSNSGQIYFGLDSNIAISSANSYNDGAWHQVTATLSSAGAALYVDGILVNSNSVNSAQTFTGYWKVGTDNLGTFPGHPTSEAFTGAIDDVRVYDRALSSAEIQAITSGNPVAANDSYGAAAGQALSVATPGVLANDSSSNGALSAVLETNVSHGTLALNANGSFRYTPSGGFIGTDSFTYHVNDGNNATSATATVTIQGVNNLTVTAMSPAPGVNLTSAPSTILLTMSSAIDPSTVNSLTVQLVRAGLDGVLGTADDVTVSPTSLSVVNGNQIKLDLTGINLPTDKYKINVIGRSAPTSGLVPAQA